MLPTTLRGTFQSNYWPHQCIKEHYMSYNKISLLFDLSSNRLIAQHAIHAIIDRRSREGIPIPREGHINTIKRSILESIIHRLLKVLAGRHGCLFKRRVLRYADGTRRVSSITLLREDMPSCIQIEQDIQERALHLKLLKDYLKLEASYRRKTTLVDIVLQEICETWKQSCVLLSKNPKLVFGTLLESINCLKGENPIKS